jgi:hypothetical protein
MERPPARLVIEWDPNSGALAYKADSCNPMEQLGCLTYAAQMLWSTLQSTPTQSRIVPAQRIIPPNGGR